MEEIRKAFESGEILTGRVLELVKGGVVSIVKGVRVFIPASECAERFLADLGVLLGTEQRFRIIKMDEDAADRELSVLSSPLLKRRAKRLRLNSGQMPRWARNIPVR